jgi:hypothetical protein
MAKGAGTTRRSFLAGSLTAALGGALAGPSVLVRDRGALGPAPALAAGSGSHFAEATATVVGSPPLSEGGYWRFVDWLQPEMDKLWIDSEGSYTTDSRIAACGLMTHAIAALQGHDGPARRDERARRLAARLCESPPWRPTPRSGPTRHTDPRSESQRHAPGWTSNIRSAGSTQHITVDPKVARALYYAWRAREPLGLSAELVARIVSSVRATAYSPFFRYPNIRLNQINFAAELAASTASMTGDTTLLRRDYRRQLGRFLDGSRRTVRPWKTTNLSPSYSFHRNPFATAGNKQNIESNEYASIVMDVIYYYEQARRAGMTPLSASQARTLRAWVKRALPAYWTHSGYLNWDTGLYLYRWHLSRYWAWSCQGLLAIASSQNFVSEDQRQWAKYIFDRSLDLYERLCERWLPDDRREPGSSLYGVTTKFSEGPHFELARFQALGAEAVLRGLGDKPATAPPPMYAFDPQIGRLTVSTPVYNTAIVTTSNDAFPYGGIDLARLFDSRQRVVSHIGGRAPAAMGLVVRDANNAIVAASQRSRVTLPSGNLPLKLTRSPQGAVYHGTRYPENPYAGTFADYLEAEGFFDRSRAQFRSRYRFYPDRIQIGWRITRSRTDALSAEALLPSWGNDAAIDVTLKTGAVHHLVDAPGQGQVPMADVDWFYISGEETGYVAVPGAFPEGAVARLLKPSEQSSNPRPGLSLSIRLSATAREWRSLSTDVTIAPAPTYADAKAFVAQLRSAGPAPAFAG